MSGLTLFRIGAGVCVGVGVLHGLASLAPPPDSPAFAFAREAMQAFALPIAGLETNLFWIHHLLDASYTASAFWLGVSSLVAAPALAARPRALRDVSLVNALGAAALAALGLYFRIVPPALFYSLSALAFAAAAMRAK